MASSRHPLRSWTSHLSAPVGSPESRAVIFGYILHYKVSCCQDPLCCLERRFENPAPRKFDAPLAVTCNFNGVGPRASRRFEALSVAPRRQRRLVEPGARRVLLAARPLGLRQDHNIAPSGGI